MILIGKIKMFSWDLLCFYSIEFLFYTITKGISASEVLIANAFYLIFKVLMEVPAVAIADILGHRKSLIIGNLLVFLHMIILIFAPGLWGILLANLFFAFGYDIKTISETNLLYDSVSTKGGEGLYSKIESKGGSWYYYLDGILCLISGYLFVVNNYIPIYICTLFTLISTIQSFQFKDIHNNKTKENKKNIYSIMKDYSSNLKISVKFILKSNRMKSYILFASVFYGVIKVIGTYKSELLLEKGLPEEQYAAILAILTLLSGIVVSYSRKVHKKFKNKTLSVMSLTYIGACIISGVVANLCTDDIAIPIIIMSCVIFKAGESLWYILEYKYLKNFTTEKMRNKIMFTYEVISCIGASIISILGSLLLKVVNINYAFILVSLVFCIAIVLCLDYMRTRFGLRPNEYKKEDIEF